MSKLFTWFFLLVLIASCTTVDTLRKRETRFEPIEQSLTNIDQMIAGHLAKNGIPDGFDVALYRKAIEKVCFPTPACRSQAEGIFNTFIVKAQKVDAMFTVMLCDKESNSKIMEDFSCNNLRVEIQSWKSEDNMACEFEVNWMPLKDKYCNY